VLLKLFARQTPRTLKSVTTSEVVREACAPSEDSDQLAGKSCCGSAPTGWHVGIDTPRAYRTQCSHCTENLTDN
jgi:hypothetical protein